MAYRVSKGRVVREATANEKAIASAIPRKDYQALNGAGTMSAYGKQPDWEPKNGVLVPNAELQAENAQDRERERLTKWHNELFAETMKGINAAFMEQHKARDVTDHPRFQIVYAGALIQLAATLLIDGGADPNTFHGMCLESYQRAYAAAPKFG